MISNPVVAGGIIMDRGTGVIIDKANAWEVKSPSKEYLSLPDNVRDSFSDLLSDCIN